MHVGFGDHGFQERHVVGALGEMGHEIGYPLARLSALFPRPRRGHDHARIALEEFHFLAGVEGLAGLLREEGLVIEGIALAGGAGHEQLDDALGARGMMKAFAEPGAESCGVDAWEHAVARKHVRERHATKTTTEFP